MSKVQRFRRRSLWVNRRIQGAIVLRLLTYYLACGVTATCMLVAWRVAVYGNEGGLRAHLGSLWSQLGPGALSILLLLPMVLFDSVRLSHRFTGPMVRLRNTLQAAARGEKVERVRLRETDFWQDLANDVNGLLEHYDSLKPRQVPTERTPEAESYDQTLASAQAASAEARRATQRAQQSSELLTQHSADVATSGAQN